MPLMSGALLAWQRGTQTVRVRLATARCFHMGSNVAAEMGDLHSSHHKGHLDYLNKLKSGKVIAVVDSAKALDAIPIWQQGDTDLVTEEKLIERRKLRDHILVVEVLEAFWEVVEHTGLTPPDTEVIDGERMLTRDGYKRLYERAYKLLLDAWDPEDAEKTIADDWAEDSDGKPGLPKVAFCDGLFELADVWTSGIDAAEYARFLWRLYLAVTESTLEEGAPFDRICRVHAWRKMQQICFDGSLAGMVDDGGDDGDEDGDGSDSDNDGGGGRGGSRGRRKNAEASKRRHRAAVRLQAAGRRKKAQDESFRRGMAVAKVHNAFGKRLAKQRVAGGPAAAPAGSSSGSSYVGGADADKQRGKEGMGFGSTTARDSAFDAKPSDGGGSSVSFAPAPDGPKKPKEGLGFGSGSSRFDKPGMMVRQATVVIQKNWRGAQARNALQGAVNKTKVGVKLGFGSSTSRFAAPVAAPPKVRESRESRDGEGHSGADGGKRRQSTEKESLGFGSASSRFDHPKEGKPGRELLRQKSAVNIQAKWRGKKAREKVKTASKKASLATKTTKGGQSAGGQPRADAAAEEAGPERATTASASLDWPLPTVEESACVEGGAAGGAEGDAAAAVYAAARAVDESGIAGASAAATANASADIASKVEGQAAAEAGTGKGQLATVDHHLGETTSAQVAARSTAGVDVQFRADHTVKAINFEDAREPPPLPPHWSIEHDDASGHDYFYNGATGESTWARPHAPVDALAEPATAYMYSLHAFLEHHGLGALEESLNDVGIHRVADADALTVADLTEMGVDPQCVDRLWQHLQRALASAHDNLVSSLARVWQPSMGGVPLMGGGNPVLNGMAPMGGANQKGGNVLEPPKSRPNTREAQRHIDSQQCYPQQGHPQQGYSQQGQGQLQRGYSQQSQQQGQGYQQQANPQQYHPQQGYSQQSQGQHPQHGYSPQGQGHPQQAYSQQSQGHSQEGYSQQGYPQHEPCPPAAGAAGRGAPRRGVQLADRHAGSSVASGALGRPHLESTSHGGAACGGAACGGAACGGAACGARGAYGRDSMAHGAIGWARHDAAQVHRASDSQEERRDSFSAHGPQQRAMASATSTRPATSQPQYGSYDHSLQLEMRRLEKGIVDFAYAGHEEDGYSLATMSPRDVSRVSTARADRPSRRPRHKAPTSRPISRPQVVQQPLVVSGTVLVHAHLMDRARSAQLTSGATTSVNSQMASARAGGGAAHHTRAISPVERFLMRRQEPPAGHTAISTPLIGPSHLQSGGGAQSARQAHSVQHGAGRAEPGDLRAQQPAQQSRAGLASARASLPGVGLVYTEFERMYGSERLTLLEPPPVMHLPSLQCTSAEVWGVGAVAPRRRGGSHWGGGARGPPSGSTVPRRGPSVPPSAMPSETPLAPTDGSLVEEADNELEGELGAWRDDAGNPVRPRRASKREFVRAPRRAPYPIKKVTGRVPEAEAAAAAF